MRLHRQIAIENLKYRKHAEKCPQSQASFTGDCQFSKNSLECRKAGALYFNQRKMHCQCAVGWEWNENGRGCE